MRKLKSAIILKDSVFIPDYDSHSKMLKELQIKDTRSNAERLFVRAELYPVNFFIGLSPFLLVLFNLVFVFFNVLD